jgi:hypothetical protein
MYARYLTDDPDSCSTENNLDSIFVARALDRQGVYCLTHGIKHYLTTVV